MTLVGLEPTISGSVDRCLIHWATGPSHEKHLLCLQLYFKLAIIQIDNKMPTVGLEPTTTRLRALRSAD